MQVRPAPLRIPDRPNWFVVVVNDQPHHFRIPRQAVMKELMAVLAATDIRRGSDLDLTKDEMSATISAGLVAMDPEVTARVRISSDAMGACIGAMWRHRTTGLDSDRHSYSNDLRGLLQFGSAVMDELEDEGYDEDAVAALIEGVTPALVQAIGSTPGAEEVTGRAASFPDA